VPISSEAIERYTEVHTSPEPPWLAAVAEATRAETSAPQMMVGHVEGRFLATLVALTRARLVLEVGTFTGYSALAMAAALPEGGRIVTCEVDERHAAIARRHVEASPYADRIEIRLGPAAETIAGLDGPFDLVFVDADKVGYLAYYEAVLPKLAPTGVIVADNVFQRGRVLEPEDDSARAIAEFNDRVVADDRVEVVMLTVRDGMSLIRHRQQPGPGPGLGA
jgi:caffeoyl-CoA O-methyltransferase